MGDDTVKKGLLELRSAGKSYPAPQGSRRVLADLDLVLDEGSFNCLIGPSGCGKTTLLKLAAGFLSPDSGRVLFDGKPVRAPGRDRVLLLQDDNQLYPWLTVLKNTAFPLRHLKRGAWEERARELLRAVHLESYARAYPHQLSGGMKQRVAIVRALAAGARLLLMDEPFGSLDAQTRRSLQDFIRGFTEENGLTVFFVTHDIEEALYLGSRILLMDNRGGLLRDAPNPLPLPRDPDSADFRRCCRDWRRQLPAPEDGAGKG